MDASAWTYITCTVIILVSHLVGHYFRRGLDQIVKERLDAQAERISMLEDKLRLDP